MENARSLGEALLVATMEGRGFVSESSRVAQLQDRRPVVLLKNPRGAYAQPPLGTNALVPPDAPLAPPAATPEAREVEKCVRQLLVALVSNLCHRIWNPAALQESAWRVPDGRRLEDFVPAPCTPVLTATAAAALSAPPAVRLGNTDWMDSYAALARAPFTSFLSAIIKGAPTSFSTIVLCHYQLETAAANGLLSSEVLGPLPPRMVILTYLSLAAKYSLDTPGSCRTWGRIGGVPPTVLAEAELAVLRSRNFELFVAPSDLLAYIHRLAATADRLSFTGSDAPPVATTAASPPTPQSPAPVSGGKGSIPASPRNFVVVPSLSQTAALAALQVLPSAGSAPFSTFSVARSEHLMPPPPSPSTLAKRKLPAAPMWDAAPPPALRRRFETLPLGLASVGPFANANFGDLPTDRPLPFGAWPFGS